MKKESPQDERPENRPGFLTNLTRFLEALGTVIPREKPKNEADGDEKEKNKVLKIIRVLLPAVSVFAALLYFFGRLYLDAYNQALGVSNSFLVFTSYDYMFSSFNIVIICLVLIILFYVSWVCLINCEAPEGRAYIIVVSLLLLWILSVAYFGMFFSKPGTFVLGVSGMATGFMIGVPFILILFAVNAPLIKGTPSRKPEENAGLMFTLVISIISIIALMPWASTELAKAQAHHDLDTFPIVEVITREALPAQLQDGSTGSANSVAGRLILSNNDRIFILRLEPPNNDLESYLAQLNANRMGVMITGRSSTGTTVTITPESTPTTRYNMGNQKFGIIWRRVYVIPTDSILEIISISENPWDKANNTTANQTSSASP